MHVLTQNGILWRTLPCPIPPGQRHKLQGVRLAGPQPLPPASMTIQRKVSSRGGIQVACQRIQVGFGHAGKTVTIQLGDTTLRIIDDQGELITTVPRNSTGEISRFKAYGTHRQQPPLVPPTAAPAVRTRARGDHKTAQLRNVPGQAGAELRGEVAGTPRLGDSRPASPPQSARQALQRAARSSTANSPAMSTPEPGGSRLPGQG
jgi:hypothetical protein